MAEKLGLPEKFQNILPGEAIVRGTFRAVGSLLSNLPQVPLASHGDHLPSWLDQPNTGAEEMLSNQLQLDLDGSAD